MHARRLITRKPPSSIHPRASSVVQHWLRASGCWCEWMLRGLTALALTGCQTLIGAEFDEDYTVCEPECDALGFACGTYRDACGNVHDCGQCDAEQQCQNNQCTCVAETCQERNYECGAFEDRCGQIQECGPCPSGQFCGGDDGHTCNSTPCTVQTCAELGLTSGKATSCGVVVNCDPAPACPACDPGRVCTPEGECCSPKPRPAGACGYLPDGCGRIELVTCPGDQVCEDGVCCTPDFECTDAASCGLNATGCASSHKECQGLCPDGTACERQSAVSPWSCGECERACPSAATCGAANDDGCGGQIVCFGSCPAGERCLAECPEGQSCVANAFECCRPSCPPAPTTCGLNPDGCGGHIECPGPCASGACTRVPGADGDTFQCQ